MDGGTKRRHRVEEVQRIFEEYGFGNVELLQDWDGDELSELADFLSEEEFQTVLDRLADTDEFRAE